MANKTAAGLVSFVKDKLGAAYVYGAKGEVLTKDKYSMLRGMYGDMVWQTDVLKVGKVCVDCSGLISWYTGTVRNSTSYKNTATKVLTIDKISQAVPGCAVWQQGHIGVYIGNGEVIEARGSAYGVVKTKVKERSFTHILWLKDIDYTSIPKASEKTSDCYPKCPYTGVSIVDGLKSIGADSSYAHREKIAVANGIRGYTGTAAQNTQMLSLLKAGKLIKA